MHLCVWARGTRRCNQIDASEQPRRRSQFGNSRVRHSMRAYTTHALVQIGLVSALHNTSFCLLSSRSMEFILPADQQMCNACMSGRDTAARPPAPPSPMLARAIFIPPGRTPHRAAISTLRWGAGGRHAVTSPRSSQCRTPKISGNIYSIHSTGRAGCLWLKGRGYSRPRPDQANAKLKNSGQHLLHPQYWRGWLFVIEKYRGGGGGGMPVEALGPTGKTHCWPKTMDLGPPRGPSHGPLYFDRFCPVDCVDPRGPSRGPFRGPLYFDRFCSVDRNFYLKNKNIKIF